MKLWLIEKTKNLDYYENIDAVVAADTEEDAKALYKGWTEKQNIRVTYLGEARERMPAGVVCGG
jgi:biotin carboxylase